LPTDLGEKLIDTINNTLLKSVELTGQWEKLLKDIEAGTYNPKAFINHMKKMVDDLVTEVRMEKKSAIISSQPSARSNPKTERKKPKRQATQKKDITQMSCPKCKSGILIKGKAAYGCSSWKSGCTFRLPFEIHQKKISDNQLRRLVEKGCTTNLKGFVLNDQKIEGLVRFDDAFNLILEQKKSKTSLANKDEMPLCPKCKKGRLIKGKTAYGCSEWKSGCDFKFLFSEIKERAQGKKLTRELVMKILSEK
jgi:DNA topoisomerase-3